MPEPLEVLARLLEAGHPPAAALALLGRSGCAWAAVAAAAVEAGADPASAVARGGALTAAELGAIGGALAALDPAALRLVASRRAHRRLIRRAVLRALALPLVAALFTLPGGWFLPRSFGARLVDALPLLAVLGVVALAFTGRLAPLLHRLGRRFVPEDTTAALAAAAPLDARGFERAARLLPAGRLARACERAGRRLAAGEPLVVVLPSAAEVGASAAQRLLLGATDPAALAAAADADARALAAAAALAARLAAWAAVFFATLRLTMALLDADLGALDGLPGLMPGVDPAAIDELLREVEGR
ncbi:MAG: hypothetical protein R3F65_26075 [bacterium]